MEYCPTGEMNGVFFTKDLHGKPFICHQSCIVVFTEVGVQKYPFVAHNVLLGDS